MHREWTRDGLVVTTDPARFDIPAIHAFLDTTYWAKGRPLAVVERSIVGSLCFTLVTRDAHELYRKFGFESLERPQNYMEIRKGG